MAAQAMGGLMDTDHRPEEGSATAEAMYDEMFEAMMNYMPLRSLISFSGGKMNHEILTQLLAQMNS